MEQNEKIKYENKVKGKEYIESITITLIKTKGVVWMKASCVDRDINIVVQWKMTSAVVCGTVLLNTSYIQYDVNLTMIFQN